MPELENWTECARPIEILLVEDDDDDVLLTTKALANDRILNNVNRVQDGVEALEYLRREGSFADAVRPDLILLDLNMPRKDGRQVLQEIKEDDDLKRIPVVVLTTSDNEADVASSYDYRANSYVTKPVDMAMFQKVVSTINEYWFTVVKLPPSSN